MESMVSSKKKDEINALRYIISDFNLKIAGYKIDEILWCEFIAEGNLKDLTLVEIRGKLTEILPAMELLHKKYYESDLDDRTGIESYGCESLEGIKSQLEYVSDRWRCTFRLRWLIDLAKNNIQVKG